MPMEAQDIEHLIRAAFPQAKITITDLAGDGNHGRPRSWTKASAARTGFSSSAPSMRR